MNFDADRLARLAGLPVSERRTLSEAGNRSLHDDKSVSDEADYRFGKNQLAEKETKRQRTYGGGGGEDPRRYNPKTGRKSAVKDFEEGQEMDESGAYGGDQGGVDYADWKDTDPGYHGRTGASHGDQGGVDYGGSDDQEHRHHHHVVLDEDDEPEEKPRRRGREGRKSVKEYGKDSLSKTKGPRGNPRLDFSESDGMGGEHLGETVEVDERMLKREIARMRQERLQENELRSVIRSEISSILKDIRPKAKPTRKVGERVKDKWSGLTSGFPGPGFR